MKKPLSFGHIPTPSLQGLIWLTFLLLMFGSSGYSQDSTFTSYYNKVYGINVSFPNKWRVSKDQPRNGFNLPLMTAYGGVLKSSVGDRFFTPSCEIFLIDSVQGKPDKFLESMMFKRPPFTVDTTLPDYYQDEVNIKSVFWIENVKDDEHSRFAYKAANFEYYLMNRSNVYQLSCECEYSKMDSLKKVFDQIAESVYFK
jgi:hypothetical protein